MAISVNQLIRDRKKWLKERKPAVREILTAGQALYRELNRVINRKRVLPEEKDIQKFLLLNKKINDEMLDVVTELSMGYPQ